MPQTTAQRKTPRKIKARKKPVAKRSVKKYVRHPGKFEGSGRIGEKLHAIAGNGFCDDECGSVTENGRWYGLITNSGIKGAEHAIVTEDDQGFFDVHDTYASAAAAQKEFDALAEEIA